MLIQSSLTVACKSSKYLPKGPLALAFLLCDISCFRSLILCTTQHVEETGVVTFDGASEVLAKSLEDCL